MVNKITIYGALEPFLCNHKNSFHLADISRKIGVAHPTLRQWLAIFENEGVLKKSIKGRLSLYALNLEHPNIIEYLSIAEKNKIIKFSQDLLVRELIKNLNSFGEENINIAIFGSFAEAPRKAKDIDILMIGKSEKKMEINLKLIHKKLHIIHLKHFKEVSESLKKEIIKKHLIISGVEDFIKWFIW